VYCLLNAEKSSSFLSNCGLVAAAGHDWLLATAALLIHTDRDQNSMIKRAIFDQLARSDYHIARGKEHIAQQ